MSDESHWIERAQSAEAKLATYKEAHDAALERIKDFKANFGVKERSDGTIVVDYERFVQALGAEGALELRGVIDQTYNITGAPGDKPRMSVKAGTEPA